MLATLRNIAILALFAAWVSGFVYLAGQASEHPHPTAKAQSYQPETTYQDRNAGLAAPKDGTEAGGTHEKQERKSEFWSAKLTDWLLAVLTGLLVLFTYRLWKSTDNLWRAGADQFELARAEFIATHRPRIELHSLKISHRSDESEPAPIEFRYVNSGDSVGHVKQVGTRLVYQREDMLQADLDFRVKEISPPMKIKSGEFGLGLTPDKSIPDLILSTNLSATDYIKFFCVAYIVYTDDLETIRQMDFVVDTIPTAG
jgi:hypothetical protein